MAFITELDVVNDMLATMGENPVNQLTDDHPLIATAKRELSTVSGREQAKGWWFNTELITLTPDPSDGSLLVPGDTLSINPFDTSLAVQRGRRMYDVSKASYVFTLPMDALLIRQLAFSDLPVSAAAYIGCSAVLKFQTDYDADNTKTGQLTRDLQNAYMEFNAEHIRNMKVNLLTTPTMMQKFNALGYSPQFGGILNVPVRGRFS